MFRASPGPPLENFGLTERPFDGPHIIHKREPTPGVLFQPPVQDDNLTSATGLIDGLNAPFEQNPSFAEALQPPL